MEIFATGLNYKTAPVEIREKFAISEEKYKEILDQIFQVSSIFEVCIISTCNRVEIYGVADDINETKEKILKIFSKYSGIPVKKLTEFMFFYTGHEAVKHIFRVSSSLDSMVIGEPQIVCQFKDSFSKAKDLKTVRHIMTKLFDKSLSVSKKVRTQTGISKKAVSISYAAIELARKIFDDLSDKNVLLIGAGEMAELAARHLASVGVKHIFVTNRTFEKAVELADEFGGSAIRFNKMEEFLPDADIIIVSTSATEPIIKKDNLKKVVKERKGNPIFIIDISVPRNVSEDVNKLSNVYLYNIDDLKNVVNSNLEQRKLEATTAELILDEEVHKFEKWLNQLKVAPLISNIRHFADEISEKQLEKLFHQMPYLNEKERENIELAVKSIINKILHRPTMYIKDVANRENKEQLIKSLEEMFSPKWELRKKQKETKIPTKTKKI